MKIINMFGKTIFVAFLTISINIQGQDEQSVFEEVIVTAEKRSESLQGVSQAVTALTSSEIEVKNINSIVDLSAIVPGVTVAKNEGYKTVISIRGVGNETNQNAIAAPSVAYHMDGIFIASPFALQSDFLDVERIEVLRGPQGTLFGQNSTGGAINVISKKPSTEERSAKTQLTMGNYNLMKLSASSNTPISDTIATRLAVSVVNRDGFSKNVTNGQYLDDADNVSIRSDWIFDINESTSLRIFGQYFNTDRNGAAMKGIDDPTLGARRLSQDTLSNQELTSSVYAAIYESDLGFANLKILASKQKDDILVDRDNDRHNFGDPVLSIPGLIGTTYIKAEFRPETSLVDTTTFEINLISNEPIMDGKMDWVVGAFYMEHEIENHIRGYRDWDANGEIRYECAEPFARSTYCYTHNYNFPAMFDVFSVGEFDFVTDSFPSRESFSLYGETTYSYSDDMRLISGLRYTEDTFKTDVANFYNIDIFNEKGTADEITGKVTLEFDMDDDTMAYVSFTRGFKPGGTNLTFGRATREELDAIFRFDAVVAPAMVFKTFDPETIDSFEVGLKTDLLDGKARANIAAFSYTYENLQFQATDPDQYQGGVANIPESEMSGVEIEFTGILSDSLTLDVNLAFIDSEVTSDYMVLDNVDAFQYSAEGEELIRYGLRENVKGNKLAKTPESTADISLIYSKDLPSGNIFNTALQYVKRGEFEQRVSNNPAVDFVDSYSIVNFTIGIDYANDWSLDFMFLNMTDEDGVNSSMTDVFGIAATGIELIPPRQIMTRISLDF
ncbi:MAG: TonB-dependent receptor [Gammaproteobacteria bacterium]|tara:strand:+ start:881 stop:3235 length:2355 start_codon:yes stop_codon:yes gene_type:complete